MTVAIDKLSFVDYCSYTDGSDRRYELVDGKLIPNYDERIFANGDRIISSIFSELILTAEQVLKGKN